MNLRRGFARTVVAFLAGTLFVADLGSVWILKTMLVQSQAQLLNEEAARARHDLATRHALPSAPMASVQSISLLGPDGRVELAVGRRPTGPLPPPGFSLIHGTMWARVPLSGGRILLIRSHDRIVDVAVSDLEKVLIPLSLLMLLLGALAAGRSARALTRPLEALAAEVRSIAETAEVERRVHEPSDPAEVLALAQDMNQMLRAIEETLRVEEWAGQRERALREMAAHDLRNPLSTVLGNLELLEGGMLAPEQARKAVRLARAAAQRLQRCVQTLLDASEEGGSDLVAVARETPGTHTLRSECGFVPVVAPAVEVAEVLATLLDNAGRHNPEGTLVEVAVGQHGSQGWLLVKDNGVGMPDGVRDHAFDRRFAGDGAGGLGLGLALARALVEARGGGVELRTEPGVGTTVEVRWPLRA